MAGVPKRESRTALPGEMIDDRFEVERALGSGGMGEVLAVRERSTGRRFALKRLLKDAKARHTMLLSREFHTLHGLAHPHVVQTFDFGLDDGLPYYTMELLEGGDLQRIAPLDYRSACSLTHDICSALSLVHSRRLVFRDISPNNVRRTVDGFAKLIDFGALAPLGPSREIVGTLPCVAPEAIGFAPLDGRTDLFALGATLYFALVRRHAYPARSVEELVEIWKRSPSKPSELVVGIPPALDQLVLDLLELDPERRPATAGEVMERLAAIAGLAPDEHVLVAQAYLATPALVGRDGIVDAVRMHVARAKEGAGGSICFQGPPGTGRSRMLDASGLEAKRMGMLVLRADARDAQLGEYGVVRALARSLLTQAPTLARKSARPFEAHLERIIPELRSTPSMPANDVVEQDLQRGVQSSLRQWICAVASECPVVISVDDLERIDLASAAFVGLMSRDAPRQRVLIMTTQTSGAQLAPALQEALKVHKRFATRVRLDPLGLELTQRLLSSLFGEVPNLPLLTQHVQRISRGNPGDVLRLAEHLVREKLITYRSGTWSLPEQLSASELPSNMAHALEQRVGRLSAGACLLCYGLACEPGWRFRFDECAALLAESNPALVMKCLRELLALDFASHVDGSYSSAQGTPHATLRARLPPAAQRDVHERLSAICAARGDAFRSAQHLFHAQKNEQGLQALVDFAVASTAKTDADAQAFQEVLRTLPVDSHETFALGLALCEQLKRPARDRRALLVRLSGLATLDKPRQQTFAQVRSLLEDLSYDVGLDCFADLPPSGDVRARIQTALGRAVARYQVRPEEQRVIDPVAAIPELVKAMAAVLGVIASTSDYAGWATLPSLSALSPLSPALTVMQWLVEGMGLRLGGRSEAALAVYGKVLERFDQPDRAGLPAVHHRYMRLRIVGGVGFLEAAMGQASSLARAKEVAEESRFESTALLIQQLYQLFQGDLREAKRTKQRLELLRLESNAQQPSEAQHLLLELAAHSLAQDMTGLKRALDGLSSYQVLNADLGTSSLYGRGEYHRMRGDHSTALAQIEQALQHMRAGQHLLWTYAASAHVRTLLDLELVERACELGRAYLAAAQDLGYKRNHVRAALSLALLRKGDHEAATRLADEAVSELRSLGSTGLHLAVACEARAQVAAVTGDTEAYEAHAALFAQQWPSDRRRLQSAADPARHDRAESDAHNDEEALAHLKSTWETCHTMHERVHAGLEVLGRHMGALGGVLFTQVEGGLVRAASYGESGKDVSLDTWATDYFAREATPNVTEDITVSATALAAEAPAKQAGALTEYAPVLLAHSDGHAYVLTGLVVLVGPETSRERQATRVATELSRCVSQMEPPSGSRDE